MLFTMVFSFIGSFMFSSGLLNNNVPIAILGILVLLGTMSLIII